MAKPRVVVLTHDKYKWMLRPFLYLFFRYWSELQPVVILGERDLPPSEGYILSQPLGEPWPASRWTDGLIAHLRNLPDDIFVLMLEDYWLRRRVDHDAVNSLAEYMQSRPDILRIDLTADRLYNGQKEDIGSWGRLDLIETPHGAPYQMSLQACLVNRANFLDVLKPGLSPWELELSGNNLIGEKYRVLGTRQWPVRYTNGWGTDCRNGKGYNLEGIEEEHIEHMTKLGFFKGKERCK